MTQTITLNAVELFVALIAVATAAALVVRRVAVPYTVALVVVGLAAGVSSIPASKSMCHRT